MIIFTKVAEQESFTGAAKMLGMPKSLVSQKVSRLEDELGMRLLHRTTRRVSLTDEGRRVAQMAGALAEQAEEIVAYADHSGDGPTGLLKVTAPHDLGIFLIRNLLPEFLAEYPAVKVEMDLSNRYVDLVEEGFDLALRATQRPLGDSSFVANRLTDTALRFYAHRDYAKQAKLPRNIKELASHPVIAYRGAVNRRGRILTVDDGKNVEAVTVDGPFHSNDMLASKHAVLGGMGIGLLPEFLVAEEVSLGELIPVLPKWGAAHASFYAVYPTRRHVAAKTRVFVEFLKESIERRRWN